jgi:single-stranded DNA-binding protein
VSLTILAQGVLTADPVSRTSERGNRFVTGLLRVPVDGDDAMLVSLIAFAPEARELLAGLKKGDSVACTGPAKLSAWTGKDGVERRGLSMTVECAMTLYGVRAKREKV